VESKQLKRKSKKKSEIIFRTPYKNSVESEEKEKAIKIKC
jgi:hypothetical protein